MDIRYLNVIYSIKHKYPWLPSLYALILQFKPKLIIEYGTELGATAVTMALALRQLKEDEGHYGKIFTYDTFEIQSDGEIGSEPPFAQAKRNLSDPLIRDYVEVDYGDFWEFCNTKNKEFDLLYFDIDNDGDKLLKMYHACKEQIDNGSIVIFEGGSHARDNVEWMIERGRVKMTDVKDIVGYKLLTDEHKYSFSIIYNPKIYNLEL